MSKKVKVIDIKINSRVYRTNKLVEFKKWVDNLLFSVPLDARADANIDFNIDEDGNVNVKVYYHRNY